MWVVTLCAVGARRKDVPYLTHTEQRVDLSELLNCESSRREDTHCLKTRSKGQHLISGCATHVYCIKANRRQASDPLGLEPCCDMLGKVSRRRGESVGDGVLVLIVVMSRWRSEEDKAIAGANCHVARSASG